MRIQKYKDIKIINDVLIKNQNVHTYIIVHIYLRIYFEVPFKATDIFSSPWASV